MKNLIALLICILLAANYSRASDTGMVSITVNDCQDDGNDITSLSFDYSYSLNSGATPAMLSGSSFSIEMQGMDLFDFTTSTDPPVMGSEEGFDFKDDLVCSDLNGKAISGFVQFKNGPFADVKGFISFAAIPTMGQWALMILGLIMTSIGVIFIKRKAMA